MTQGKQRQDWAKRTSRIEKYRIFLETSHKKRHRENVIPLELDTILYTKFSIKAEIKLTAPGHNYIDVIVIFTERWTPAIGKLLHFYPRGVIGRLLPL